MPRYVSPAEYKRLVEQHNREQKRRIENYNREVKKINDHNKRVVNAHNTLVTKYNDTQRKNRQALNYAIQRYNTYRRTAHINTSYVVTHSVELLQQSYQVLNQHSEELSDSPLVRQYPEQEASNSIQLYNSVNGIDPGEYIEPITLQRSAVEEQLHLLSPELYKRWKGALFSLSPGNPDAARHFCSSVREIFTQVIDLKAPDKEVENNFLPITYHNNRPDRRSKIKYILLNNSVHSPEMENFLQDNINDLTRFYQELNDGTHGYTGKFDTQQLLKMKKRAEDSIIYLTAF
jgi:hypothetical protein